MRRVHQTANSDALSTGRSIVTIGWVSTSVARSRSARRSELAELGRLRALKGGHGSGRRATGRGPNGQHRAWDSARRRQAAPSHRSADRARPALHPWPHSKHPPAPTLLECAESSHPPTSAFASRARSSRRALIGQAVVASTAAGRGPLALALSWRACQRPARPDGGEVPRAATGRSPDVRALSMSTRKCAKTNGDR